MTKKYVFENHIKHLQKSWWKALCPIKLSYFLQAVQKNLVSQGMIQTRFSYRPLILVYTSRKRNSLIIKVHKRSLGIVAGEFHLPLLKDSSFEIRLEGIKELSIHQRNFKVLMTET